MIFTKVNNTMENRMNEEQGFFEKKRIYTHNSYNIMVNNCPSLKLVKDDLWLEAN